MKKTHILLSIMCISLALIAIMLNICNSNTYPKQYTIQINDSEQIAKISVRYENGDVYEITNTDIIQSFIQKANGTTFEIGEYLGKSSWTSGAIHMYDQNDQLILSISTLGKYSITYGKGPHVYKSKNGYSLEILENQGTFIENIYAD